MNREKNPPTISAKVFEWLPGFDDGTTLVRQAVPSSQRFDVLSSYAAAQKRYDAINNEWDCCEGFSPDAAIDDDLEDVIEYTTTAYGEIDPEHHAIPPPPPVESLDNTSAPNSTSYTAPPTSEGADIESPVFYPSEPLETLSNFYGFVPPLPLPSGTSLEFREGAQCTKLLHWLGDGQFPETFLTTAQGCLSYEFLHDLIEGKRTHSDKSDLDKSN